MPRLVGDPQPAEFEALAERRRRVGQDAVYEVWEGVYVMNPAPAERHAGIAQQLAELLGPPARAAGLVPMMSIFNLGEPGDYRIPDGGLQRERPGLRADRRAGGPGSSRGPPDVGFRLSRLDSSRTKGLHSSGRFDTRGGCSNLFSAADCALFPC